MKAITIRVEVDHNSYFELIEEVRFNGEIIHENKICWSKLHSDHNQTIELRDAITRIYDKDISYKYISKYREYDHTKEIKRKIDTYIKEYKVFLELKEISKKYNMNFEYMNSLSDTWYWRG